VALAGIGDQQVAKHGAALALRQPMAGISLVELWRERL
jgi:hypothetical protein